MRRGLGADLSYEPADAAWDFAHHRAKKVVLRAWAEGCCVVDLFGATAIAFLP